MLFFLFLNCLHSIECKFYKVRYFGPICSLFCSQMTWHMLLLLLTCFSRVRLCVTSKMAAHQAPLSLGFSRQEHWSGLPFPSSMSACMHAKSIQSCLTLCNPMDSSPPGASVPGILQARIQELVAISLSDLAYNKHLLLKKKVMI